jgi:hypothetical protein
VREGILGGVVGGGKVRGGGEIGREVMNVGGGKIGVWITLRSFLVVAFPGFVWAYTVLVNMCLERD